MLTWGLPGGVLFGVTSDKVSWVMDGAWVRFPCFPASFWPCSLACLQGSEDPTKIPLSSLQPQPKAFGTFQKPFRPRHMFFFRDSNKNSDTKHGHRPFFPSSNPQNPPLFTFSIGFLWSLWSRRGSWTWLGSAGLGGDAPEVRLPPERGRPGRRGTDGGTDRNGANATMRTAYAWVLG